MTGCQLAFRVAGPLVALAFLAVFGGFPRPAAFAIFALYAVAWIAIGNGFEWHSLATLATWAMTLVIQRAEHRDTQAIHAKLDELLKAGHRANNEIMSIDDKDAEEVEQDRERVRRP